MLQVYPHARFDSTSVHLSLCPPISSHSGLILPPPVAKPNQLKQDDGLGSSLNVHPGMIHSLPNAVPYFSGRINDLVGRLGVHLLLEHDAELLAQGLELLEVLLVLALVLDLGLDAYEGVSGMSAVCPRDIGTRL